MLEMISIPIVVMLVMMLDRKFRVRNVTPATQGDGGDKSAEKKGSQDSLHGKE